MDPGYRDRAASLADVAAVVRLLRAHELADHGRVTADWNEIVPFVWRNPGFHDAEDGRIVERDAVPVAFAGVFREDDAGVEPLGSWVASPPADRACNRPTPGSSSPWCGPARGRWCRLRRWLAAPGT